MDAGEDAVVAVSRRSVGALCGGVVLFEGLGCLALVGPGASHEVVGEHALVGRTMAVEPGAEGGGEGVVGHERVALVAGLKLLELLAHAVATAAAAYEQTGKRADEQ